MLRITRIILMILGIALMSGCASEKNIAVPNSFWQTPKQKVTVSTTKAPTPMVYQVGNQGLLDYAINSAMNNKLNNYLKTLDLAWYNQLPKSFAKELNQRHINAVVYPDQLRENATQMDYDSVAIQTNTNEMLVIKLVAIGAMRHYSAFIATTVPQAYCVLKGELINTATNEVMWRYHVNALQAVDEPWDQPPNYPNFTNALKIAINSAQQELIDSFVSGH